jgi:DNA-binding NtrC family response regulator
MKVQSIPSILSVSPSQQDHAALRDLSGAQWNLYSASDLRAAMEVLRKRDIAAVVCECDSAPGNWTGLLERMSRLPQAPPLIVASRCADERLWVAALNLGAYDVLAKPFDSRELRRSVTMAASNWYRRHGIPPAFEKVMRAAG